MVSTKFFAVLGAVLAVLTVIIVIAAIVMTYYAIYTPGNDVWDTFAITTYYVAAPPGLGALAAFGMAVD